MASGTIAVGHANVVSHAEWLAARGEFPKGRDEDPGLHQSWVRHQDRHTEGYFVDPAQKYGPRKSSAGSCCSGERHS
jgi:hypothetical protein